MCIFLRSWVLKTTVCDNGSIRLAGEVAMMAALAVGLATYLSCLGVCLGAFVGISRWSFRSRQAETCVGVGAAHVCWLHLISEVAEPLEPEASGQSERRQDYST